MFQIALVSLVLIYGILELLSFGFLRLAQSVRPLNFAVNIDQYLADTWQEDYEEFLAKGFDPTMGWAPTPNDSDVRTNCLGEEWSVATDSLGARTGGADFGPTVIAAYGDSFTHGNEVDGDQSWPSILATTLETSVHNFGVSGYGTGQALLRFEKNLEAGVITPITILGIYEENISRLVNSYRPFYVPTARRFGFKPSFRAESDRIVEIPNPNFQPKLSMADLRKLAQDINSHEFHAARKITPKFPYTAKAFHLAVTWSGKIYRRYMNNQYFDWHSDEAQSAMEHVIDRFVDRARGADSAPIVLFIPAVKAISDNGTSSYSQFVKRLRAIHPELPVFDILDAKMDLLRFNLRPKECHASPYGNKVIAEHIAVRLEQIDKVVIGNAESVSFPVNDTVQK